CAPRIYKKVARHEKENASRSKQQNAELRSDDTGHRSEVEATGHDVTTDHEHREPNCRRDIRSEFPPEKREGPIRRIDPHVQWNELRTNAFNWIEIGDVEYATKVECGHDSRLIMLAVIPEIVGIVDCRGQHQLRQQQRAETKASDQKLGQYR